MQDPFKIGHERTPEIALPEIAQKDETYLRILLSGLWRSLPDGADRFLRNRIVAVSFNMPRNELHATVA
jgi:hypothetical protein